jgi:hypothetical protein
MASILKFNIETKNQLGTTPNQPIDDAARIIRGVLGHLKRPPNLEDVVNVTFQNDASGDQAVYLIFQLKDDEKSPEKIDELGKLSRTVVAELLNKKLSFWPYVRFDIARSHEENGRVAS